MIPSNCCPNDDALLSVVLGDPLDEAAPAHLSDCPRCQRRLDHLRSAISDLRQAATWSTATHSPVTPVAGEGERAARRPAMIGKYIVVGALDEGGQALIYRALHPALGKDVAIKWGRKSASLETADRDCLVTEGRLLAELDHPNLARIFDLDFHEGRPFLAMEYVRGRDLHGTSRQQRLTPRQAARVVADVARAVAEAHRRGITHQDITPRNILLGEDGRPRLIDFGLARLRRAWGDSAAEPIGGTPGFMAPEQARGEADAIGPPSDIFALGGVLYYLLVGKPPFAGDNPYLVLQRTGQGGVDLPPLRAAKAPRTLTAICRRALADDPLQRYPTADALADDLERYLRQPRRRLLLVLASLTLLLTLGGGTMLFLWLTTPDFPGRQPLIGEVRRSETVLLPNLRAALPLCSGDRFPIRCDLPRGCHAVLFALDAQGRFTAYADAAPASAGRFDRLSYPPGDRLLRLSGPPGTELLLVCANRFTSPRADEVQALLTGDGPWPPLPDYTAVLLDRDGVEVVKGEGMRDIEFVEGDELTKVRSRMEQLRQALCRRYDFVAALAYPHREP